MKRTLILSTTVWLTLSVGTLLACNVAPIAYMDFSMWHYDTTADVFCVHGGHEMLAMNAGRCGGTTIPMACSFQPGIRSSDDDFSVYARLPDWQYGIRQWLWAFGDGEDYWEWLSQTPGDFGWGGSCASEGGEGTDEVSDLSEVGYAGSDDVDLNDDDPAEDDNIPDEYEDENPAWIEPAANAAENTAEHDYWETDWGNPGKQHATNKKYSD